MEARIPFDVDTFIALDGAFWRRELWDGQPQGKETGWENRFRHTEVALNVLQFLERACAHYGGSSCWRADVALSDTAAVAPDACYFQAGRNARLIGGDFCAGPPDVIAEVLSPPTRTIDRGERMEVYCRAGVPHLWLLDPETETAELFELARGEYRRVGAYGAGDAFHPARFPELKVAVDTFFDTQWKRNPGRRSREPEKPVPEWLVPPERQLGLEYLLIAGHPERRREIWDDRAPCVLAFGSELEARARFRHFVEEACRWEQLPVPSAVANDSGMESTEIGRFRFAREGRRVHLEVAVDGRRYRDLLEVWTQDDAWDWGEHEPGEG